MKLLLALSFASLFTSGASVAQNKSTSLTGAWRVTKIQTPGTNGQTISGSKIQPSLFLFTGEHYSFLQVTSPRPDLKENSKPTAEDLRAVWGPFMANSGTYEIRGGTLTTHPVVAKNPFIMARGTQTYSFKLEGKTLTLTGLDSLDTGLVRTLERIE